MTYSIIGSGAIGSALATRFSRKALPVRIANSRGPDSMADLAARLGPLVAPVSMQEAVQAEVVILAIPFTAIPAAVGQVQDWNGRIVVDASNAIDFPAFTPSDLGGKASTSVVAEAVPGAHVVKAFNTLPAALLASEPAVGDGRRVLFISGDHPESLAEVSGLVDKLGFAGIVLGTVSEAGRAQQFGGPLVAKNLVRYE